MLAGAVQRQRPAMLRHDRTEPEIEHRPLAGRGSGLPDRQLRHTVAIRRPAALRGIVGHRWSLPHLVEEALAQLSRAATMRRCRSSVSSLMSANYIAETSLSSRQFIPPFVAPFLERGQTRRGATSRHDVALLAEVDGGVIGADGGAPRRNSAAAHRQPASLPLPVSCRAIRSPGRWRARRTQLPFDETRQPLAAAALACLGQQGLEVFPDDARAAASDSSRPSGSFRRTHTQPPRHLDRFPSFRILPDVLAHRAVPDVLASET